MTARGDGGDSCDAVTVDPPEVLASLTRMGTMERQTHRVNGPAAAMNRTFEPEATDVECLLYGGSAVDYVRRFSGERERAVQDALTDQVCSLRECKDLARETSPFRRATSR